MTEKNIFVYKLFLSINISDLFVFRLHPLPLEKGHPMFPNNPPLKTEILSSLPFLKIWWEAQPPCRMGGGGCKL